VIRIPAYYLLDSYRSLMNLKFIFSHVCMSDLYFLIPYGIHRLIMKQRKSLRRRNEKLSRVKLKQWKRRNKKSVFQWKWWTSHKQTQRYRFFDYHFNSNCKCELWQIFHYILTELSKHVWEALKKCNEFISCIQNSFFSCMPLPVVDSYLICAVMPVLPWQPLDIYYIIVLMVCWQALWKLWWTFGFHNGRGFLDQLIDYKLFEKDPVPCMVLQPVFLCLCL
jgi:hypothetical protein